MMKYNYIRSLWGVFSLLLFLLVACDQHKPSPNLSFANPQDEALALYHSDIYRIELSGVTDPPTWSIQDRTVATVNDQGLMVAGLVGQSAFAVQSGEQILNGTITVRPRYHAYREPLYGAAISRKQVEDYETREFEKEQPFIEGQLLLRYKGERPEIKRVVYIYDEVADRVLQAYVELASLDQYTALHCFDFLAERYYQTDTDSDNVAPDGSVTPIFWRADVMVKPRKVANSGVIFYIDPTK